MDAPNIKNLLAALAGAVGGGVAGGPVGALLGAGAMYFSANVSDDIEAEAKATIEQRDRWRRLGAEGLLKLPAADGHVGLNAGYGWAEGTGQLTLAYGRLREEMNNKQYDAFIAETGKRATLNKYNSPQIGDYYRREISYMDFIKARKVGFDTVDDGIKVKSPKIDENTDKARQAALALEHYREVLQHLDQQLEKSQMASSLKAVMASFDVVIDKAKMGGDPFKLIDLEKQKAEVKALNDYATELDRIDKLQADLDNAKTKASLSKTKPEDAAAEKKVQDEINSARIAAYEQYRSEVKKARSGADRETLDADTKILQERNNLTLELTKKAYQEHLEMNITMGEALSRAMVEPTTEAWEKHYEGRKKMEEEAIARSKTLYAGLVEDMKQGMRGLIDSLMKGGHGNPFSAVYQSFQAQWTEYLGSFSDKWLKQLAIIASGENTPYRYTRKGETGANDPGGLPLYAGSAMTNRAKYAMAGIQGATALYGLYASGQAGATPGQNALSGAMSGAAIGAQVYGWVGALVGAVVGAIAGYLTGKEKVGYNVTVVNGKLVVTGSGSANKQDISSALAGINSAIETTANSAYGILFSFPAAIMQSLGSFKPGDLKQTGSRWFDNNSLKLFLQQDVPKMVFQSFQPALMAGFEALGVGKAKLTEIFKRVDDPSFDPKDFLQKLNDYAQIIVGLQEAMKLSIPRSRVLRGCLAP
jgi:hypothetical protein